MAAAAARRIIAALPSVHDADNSRAQALDPLRCTDVRLAPRADIEEGAEEASLAAETKRQEEAKAQLTRRDSQEVRPSKAL